MFLISSYFNEYFFIEQITLFLIQGSPKWGGKGKRGIHGPRIPPRAQHNDFTQYGGPDWEEKGAINGPRMPQRGQHNEFNQGQPNWEGGEKGGINGPRKYQNRWEEWRGACARVKKYCLYLVWPPLVVYCLTCIYEDL